MSSDAGYIYNTFGFATIEEMELLQEAGFHPLEIVRGATMHAAEALYEPKGKPIEFGVVRAGLLADLVIVPEDPIANLKVLYGTGAVRLNEQTGKAESAPLRGVEIAFEELLDRFELNSPVFSTPLCRVIGGDGAIRAKRGRMCCFISSLPYSLMD